jgi:hypothetical protein
MTTEMMGGARNHQQTNEEQHNIMGKEEMVINTQEVGHLSSATHDLGRRVDCVSWNRMRVHKQREVRKPAVTTGCSASEENAQKIIDQDRGDDTVISSSLCYTKAAGTSDEKQRKLHRRASNDAVKKIQLHCCDLSPPASPRRSKPADPPSKEGAGTSPKRTMVYKAASAIALGEEKGGALVKIGDHSELSPQKRRRYARRNSFVIRKNNPFISKGGQGREHASISNEEDLIQSLFEQVNYHRKGEKSTDIRCVEDATIAIGEPSTAAADGNSEASNSTVRKSKMIGRSKGSPPLVPSFFQDSVDTLDHEWANLSWSDPDDTKWYRRLSTLSFEPSGEEERATSSSTTIPRSRPIVPQHDFQCDRQAREADDDTGFEVPTERSQQRLEPPDHPFPREPSFLTSPRLVASASIKEQKMPHRVMVDLLTEDSPITPRLLVCHGSSSRKKVVSNDDVGKRAPLV